MNKPVRFFSTPYSFTQLPFSFSHLKNWKIGLIVLSMALLPMQVWALSSDRDQPVNLEADSADIDDKQGVSVYRGNVILTQGSMQLKADELTLYHNNKRDLTKAIATGKPAKFKQRPDGKDADMNATANKMIFYVLEDKIHLIDEAVLWQNKDSFRGNKIVYDTKAGTVKATGGVKVKGDKKGKKERIRVTIQPRKKSN